MSPIEHYDDRGLAKFIDRHRDYAVWEARRSALLDAEGKAAWDRLTPRQRFKYKHMRRWWYPWFYFLYAYVVRLGFLDGSAGFHYAFFKTWYFSSVRLLMIEQRAKTSPRPEHEARSPPSSKKESP